MLLLSCDARELQLRSRVAMSSLQGPCPTSMIDLPTVVKHNTTDHRCTTCRRHAVRLTSQDQHRVEISQGTIATLPSGSPPVNNVVRTDTIYVAAVLVITSRCQVQPRLTAQRPRLPFLIRLHANSRSVSIASSQRGEEHDFEARIGSPWLQGMCTYVKQLSNLPGLRPAATIICNIKTLLR